MSEIKDSGTRRSFGTGSVRDAAEGKGRFDLLPEYAIQALALHFEMGAKKYGEDNWRMGQPLKTYLDAALRHLFKHSRGERDEPHLAAAAWNVMCMIDTAERIKRGLLPKDLDNLRPVVPDSVCGNVNQNDPNLIDEATLKALREAKKEFEAMMNAEKSKPQGGPVSILADKIPPKVGTIMGADKSGDIIYRKPRIYYAHPLTEYDTVEEAGNVDMLQKMGFEVINPNSPGIQAVFKDEGSEYGMRYCCDLIRSQADVLVFNAFPDGTIGAGVASEIKAAYSRNIPVIEIPQSTAPRELSIAETKRKLAHIRANREKGKADLDEWRMLL
jgi:hypothetical protein